MKKSFLPTSVGALSIGSVSPGIDNKEKEQIYQDENDFSCYIKRNGNIIREKDQSYTLNGDWYVYEKTNNFLVCYFSSFYSRSEVRFAYSKFCNIPFHFTRAIRIKKL
jgi:hypothetical protein